MIRSFIDFMNFVADWRARRWAVAELRKAAHLAGCLGYTDQAIDLYSRATSLEKMKI